MAWGDYDNDGDLDLYLANTFGANKLFRNEVANGNHWLQVKLQGTVSNRAGIGARVAVVAGGVARIRELSGGSGLGSQDALVASFGLGSATTMTSLEVRWPSGIARVVSPAPAVNQVVTVVEVENTQPGSDVSVNPVDSGLGLGDVTHTFENVTEPGVMTRSSSSTGHRRRTDSSWSSRRRTSRSARHRSSMARWRCASITVACRSRTSRICTCSTGRGAWGRGRTGRPSGAGGAEAGGWDVRSGLHTVAWDGTDESGRRVGAGVYLCRLRAAEFTATRRVVLMP